MVYKKYEVKIDGVPCSMVSRLGTSGEYSLMFERPAASLERIEAINWKRPRLSGPCGLPAGYGFEVKSIDYHMGDKSFHVTVKVREQYLGDVTGYQAELASLAAEKAALEEDNAAKAASVQALEDQLAEADEMTIELFEELEAAQAGKEAAE